MSKRQPPTEGEPQRSSPSQPRELTPARGAVSVTGVRLTQGNAVDCPQIRADDGQVHVVSRLSSGVAIGDRVSISGFYGVTTSCQGTVLVVETESRLGN